MKKFNFKKMPVFVLILIMSAVFLHMSDVTYAGDIKSRVVISGKVVYSDNNSPVNGGSVKVTRVNGASGIETVIENAVINSNGQFKLTNIVPGNTDDIKIMCYPNDYEDNIQFEPVSVNFNSAKTNSGNEFSIIIKVERSVKKNPKGFK